MIFLAEITAYNLTTNAVETLRFSTLRKYVNAITGHVYLDRIEQPALLSREIFSGGQIGGSDNSTYGELTLFNTDGGLDYLTNYAFDGRSLLILIGNYGDAYTSFTPILKATISQARFEFARVSIVLRDRKAEFDKPLQPNLFAGDNVLPDGLEGVSDFKGTQKPKLIGRVSNVSPLLVNTSKLIYQVNDGAIAEIVNVMDKGSYIARGADYANQADMDANGPSPGFFRILKSDGYFRLGTSPTGTITCSAWQSFDIADCTVAQVIYNIITTVGGLVSDTVDYFSTDFALLNSQNAGSVGLYASANQTIAEALDQLSASVGAWWGFDALGRFRLSRLDKPSGMPVLTLSTDNILSVEREQLSVNNLPAPVFKVTINHDINWTVQAESSLAGVVPDERRTWLAQASRQAVVEDSAIKTKHPFAQEIVYDTLLTGPLYAQPEAQRRLDMLKTPSHMLIITVLIDVGMLSVVDVGLVVSVIFPRYGLDAGALYRIIGIQTDYEQSRIHFRLWGG